MRYLSDVINKKIYQNRHMRGNVVDLIVSDNPHDQTVSKLVIKRGRDKFVVDADSACFVNEHWVTKENIFNPFRYTEKNFLLAEDLLDKQVIDINGRRLVRVNDVILKENGKITAEGIDIGFSGVLRRLGLPNLFGLKTITLPWSLIGAFDYQTGTVQIKVTQDRLNTFHPAEIADILEDAGVKERIGIVESLDAQKAAAAIEEADEETQSAILEQIPTSRLQPIIEKMRLSEIADILHTVNSFTGKQIFKMLGKDNAHKLQKLLAFEDDEAGGMMDITFYQEMGDATVEKALESLAIQHFKPETIILTDAHNVLTGTLNIKNIVSFDTSLTLLELPHHTHSVTEQTKFSQIFKIFSEYNIRALPVVDQHKHVLGVIRIDTVLAHLQEQEGRENAI